MPGTTRTNVATSTLPDLAYFPVGGGPSYADLKGALLRCGFSNIQTIDTGNYATALTLTIDGRSIDVSPTSGGVPNPKPKYDIMVLISVTLSNPPKR